MPYDQNDDDAIKHGTLKAWLNYRLYGVLAGKWVVGVVALAALVVGLLA